MRPHRPPSPVSAPAVEEKGGKGAKKDDKKSQPPPEPEPEPEVPENGQFFSGSTFTYRYTKTMGQIVGYILNR